jgi:hypothetical protein
MLLNTLNLLPLYLKFVTLYLKFVTLYLKFVTLPPEFLFIINNLTPTKKTLKRYKKI